MQMLRYIHTFVCIFYTFLMILTPASLLLDFLGLLLCLLADGVLGCGLGLGPLSLGLEFYYLHL